MGSSHHRIAKRFVRGSVKSRTSIQGKWVLCRVRNRNILTRTNENMIAKGKKSYPDSIQIEQLNVDYSASTTCFQTILTNESEN